MAWMIRTDRFRYQWDDERGLLAPGAVGSLATDAEERQEEWPLTPTGPIVRASTRDEERAYWTVMRVLEETGVTVLQVEGRPAVPEVPPGAVA